MVDRLTLLQDTPNALLRVSGPGDCVLHLLEKHNYDVSVVN